MAEWSATAIGERMYLELFNALNDMDRSAKTSGGYTNELDPFITTTDLLGTALPWGIGDRALIEQRHRALFKLSVREGKSEEFCRTEV